MTTSARSTKVYAFGSNGNGQLGIGYTEDTSTPEACSFDSAYRPDDKAIHRDQHVHILDDSIQAIVAGGNHTLILTGDGRVFASGNNEDGRCGLPVEENLHVLRFTLVQQMSGRGITSIAAAWAVSYFVVDGQKVYVSGAGDKGELGLGAGVTHAAKPLVAFDVAQVAFADESIVQIAASMNHVLVLLSNGDVYGWGASRKGQLGEQCRPEKICWAPCKLSVPFGVRRLVVGRDYTVLFGLEHEFAFIGDSKHISNEADHIARGIESENAQSGWGSLICEVNGTLKGFGRNDRGQLPPDGLEFIANFAMGSEHTLALTKEGLVVAWGWGEHGNCGLTRDARGNVAGKANSIKLQLKPNERIAGLAAGCATSFIWTYSEGPSI